MRGRGLGWGGITGLTDGVMERWMKWVLTDRDEFQCSRYQHMRGSGSYIEHRSEFHSHLLVKGTEGQVGGRTDGCVGGSDVGTGWNGGGEGEVRHSGRCALWEHQSGR